MSVRPSVLPSDTLWHCVKTTQARITKSSPTDSPRTLVFGIKNHIEIRNGSPRARALNERGVRKIRNFQTISGRISETVQDRTKVTIKLLLITNRKSHTPFRLVPKSTTLDDLERPIRTLLQKRCVFRSLQQKNWMKIDPYYQQQNVGHWLYFLATKGLCGYSQGLSGERASNDSGVIENVDFSGLLDATSSAP